jgi:hypothetical protein
LRTHDEIVNTNVGIYNFNHKCGTISNSIICLKVPHKDPQALFFKDARLEIRNKLLVLKIMFPLVSQNWNCTDETF